LFLDKVVHHLDTDLSLIIPSLGTISTDAEANIKFSGIYPFITAIAPAPYAPCPNPNVSWIGSTANQVTVDSVEVYGNEVELHFYLVNGKIEAFASDYVCTYYYDYENEEEISDCNSEFSSHVIISEADRGKQFMIDSPFADVQFRLIGFTSNFSHAFY